MSSNILFVFAHPDDESFGPAGTIAKMAQHNNVTVLSLCKGDRPGAEEVSKKRQDAFKKACKLLGATPMLGNSSDAALDYDTALADITHAIREVDPVAVYTHNISDLHRDHRVSAEATMVACRPKPECNVSALFMCEIPASTEWTFGTIGVPFTPTVFTDISEFMDLKVKAMQFYKTEIYDAPDARSIENMVAIATKRGYQVGADFAEAFQLVFFHDRKTQ
jgi:N-acetylglucosamine malate deacetylase 1